MSFYQTSKKVRYTVSVIYLIFMVFIVGGTYLSQQDKAESENQAVLAE